MRSWNNNVDNNNNRKKVTKWSLMDSLLDNLFQFQFRRCNPWWTLPPQWLNGVPACCILIAENVLFSSWFTQMVQPSINHSWGMSDKGNGNVGMFPVWHIFTGVHLLDTGQSWSELEVCRTWIRNVLLIVVATPPGEASGKHAAFSSIDKHTEHRRDAVHTDTYTQWVMHKHTELKMLGLRSSQTFPVHFTQIRPLCSNQTKTLKFKDTKLFALMDLSPFGFCPPMYTTMTNHSPVTPTMTTPKRLHVLKNTEHNQLLTISNEKSQYIQVYVLMLCLWWHLNAGIFTRWTYQASSFLKYVF